MKIENFACVHFLYIIVYICIFIYIYIIIHVLHGFEGDIPEYLPRGDRKALLCRPMSKFFNLIFLVGADVDSRVLSKADKNYVKNAVFRAH